MAYSLADCLDGFRRERLFPAFRPKLKLERAVAEIRRGLGNIQPKEPTSSELEETYKVLLAASRSRLALLDVPRRHIRRGPWVLFDWRDGNGKALAESTRFLAAYQDRLREMGSARAVLTLAHCFLLYYPDDALFFHGVRQFLADTIPGLDGARAHRFQERATRFGLLDRDAPHRLAVKIAESVESAVAIVDLAGLSGQLAGSRLMERAFTHWLDQIQESLRMGRLGEAALQRLFDFARLPATEGGGLRFEGQRVRLAEALLLPFAPGTVAGPHAERVREFLLQVYGDPRIHRDKWRRVSEEARAVLLRWLVALSLEDFFRILTRAAHRDPDADRQWPYRRAFWLAYFRGGYLSDAWVALGPEVARDAKEFLSEGAKEYAKLLKGNNVRSNHAVLILRIGDLIISEWSHVGQFRVWHRDSPKAPRLYRQQYSRDDVIQGADFYGPHAGSKNRRWQEKLEVHISKQTGISIPWREYMP